MVQDEKKDGDKDDKGGEKDKDDKKDDKKVSPPDPPPTQRKSSIAHETFKPRFKTYRTGERTTARRMTRPPNDVCRR